MKNTNYLEKIVLIDCLEFLGHGQSPSYVEEESQTSAINKKCVRNSTVDVSYARAHNSKVGVKDTSILREGDICINSTGTGTIGRIGLWESGDSTDRYFADSHVTIARPNKGKVNPKYLAALLESAPTQTDIETYCFSGSTNQIELNRTAFSELSLEIIPIEAQHIVSNILSTIDLAIAQTEAIIAKQQRIKTGLMQDLLTKGIDENGNIRSEETHEFKDSPLGRIPVEWEVKELRDTGAWLSGGTPSKSEETYWGSPIPWVSSKDMKVFDLENTLEMITKKGALAGSKVVPKGSILIIVRGMILAHTFPVAYLARDMAFNQDIKAIIPNDNICGRYLAYWFLANSSNLLRLTTTATHGTKRLDTNELLEFSLSLPSKIEQNQIILLLDKLQYDIEISKEYLKKLIAKKTGLMQDLLTGKVRVTELLKDIDR